MSPSAGGLVKAYLSILPPASAPGVGAALGAVSGLMGSMGAVGAAQRSMAGFGMGAGSGPRQVTFKFNPNQYSVSKSSNWHFTPRANRRSTPDTEHLGSNPRSMNLELFLDETDSITGDVSRDVETLMSCCNAPADAPGHQSRPPTVIFGWGTTIGFKAYLSSVNATYTLFRPNGTPIRATCRVHLTELPDPPRGTNPTSGAVAAHGTRTVVAGDTLASLAFQEYRSTRYWRALAEANDIDDPTRLRTGRRLFVPPPVEAGVLA